MVGQCQQNGETCGVVTILNKMVREGLTDKVIFEQNPKGGEEASHVDCLREQHCRQRKQHVQRPEVEGCLVLQVTARRPVWLILSEREVSRYDH